MVAQVQCTFTGPNTFPKADLTEVMEAGEDI